MAFFKKVVTSIKDFEKYPELANQPVISTFKYFLLLMVILTIIISSIFIYQIYNFMQYVKNNIPDFEFVNNTLQIELDEPINTKDNNLFFKTFIIDTNDIENSQFKLYRNEIANSMTGIAFLKDRVLISVGKGIQPIEYSYDKLFESMGEDNLSKEEVVSVFDSDEIFYAMTIMLTTLFIYGFMYYFVDTLMLAILVTFLGYITSMIVRMRIKFYAIFNMAIYSFTLPIILLAIYSIIHMFTGFEIIYFDIMYFGIACIYMITAILMIKLDLIKRGEELTKIIEEQARIAEWQKKDKENEEKNKKQDEEKKKEENKENDDVENKENKKEKQKDNNGRKEENTDKQENKEKEKDSVAEGSNNKEKEEKNGNDEEQKKKGKSKGSSGQSKNGTEKQKEDNGKTSSKKKTGKQRNNNEDSNRGLEPQGNMFENEKGIQE